MRLVSTATGHRAVATSSSRLQSHARTLYEHLCALDDDDMGRAIFERGMCKPNKRALNRAFAQLLSDEYDEHGCTDAYLNITQAYFRSAAVMDFDSVMILLACISRMRAALNEEFASLGDDQRFSGIRNRATMSSDYFVRQFLDGNCAVKPQPGNLRSLSELMKSDVALRGTLVLCALDYRDELFAEWIEICTPYGHEFAPFWWNYSVPVAAFLGRGDASRETLALALAPTWSGTYDELVATLDELLAVQSA